MLALLLLGRTTVEHYSSTALGLSRRGIERRSSFNVSRGVVPTAAAAAAAAAAAVVEYEYDACTGSSAVLPPAECAAWIDLYDATGGARWGHCSGARLDPCGCSGLVASVACAGGHIAVINLPYCQLAGSPQSLPATLGNLTELTDLTLFSNQLRGTVPAELSRLTALTHLSLGENMFTGKLPPLPFARYTYCCLQQSGGLQPGTNHYACPLPAGAGACTGGGNCNTTCI